MFLSKFQIPNDLPQYRDLEINEDYCRQYFENIKPQSQHPRIKFNYYTPEIPQEEYDLIKEFKLNFEKNTHAPIKFLSDNDIRRFLKVTKRKYSDFEKRIVQHQEWRAKRLEPMKEATLKARNKYLNDGFVFISGRDNFLSPIVNINTYMVDHKKVNIEGFNEALSSSIDVCIKHMYVPGYVEGIVFLIDTGEKSMFDLPYGALKNVIDTLSTHYPESLTKIYVLKPSKSLRIVWRIILSIIPKEAHAKIELVNTKDIPTRLSEEISNNQLLKYYGGNKEYNSPFWPPKKIDLPDIQTFKAQKSWVPLLIFGLRCLRFSRFRCIF